MPYFATKKVKGKKYLYIVWGKRVGKRTKTVRQIYLGTAERVALLLEQPIPKFISHSYGEVALLLHIAELSNFVSIVDKHLRKVASIGDYLLLPVINRLLKPKSKAGIKEWYEKSCLSIVWDKNLSLSSQNYWHYLDQLSDEKIKKIWRELLLNVKEKLKVDDSTFLFDPTNFFTYIEAHEGNTLAKKGHNKQMRNDKNQLSLSLFIGQESELPYDFNCYPGNIHDSKHFRSILPELKQKVGFYNTEKITLVFDKGNNSEENFEAIKDYYFTGALPKDKEEARELFEVDFKFCYKNSKGNEVKSVSKETEVYGIKCKITVSYNEELKKKQMHGLEEKIIKTQEKFRQIEHHNFNTEKTATNAIIEILPKKQNPFDYEIKKEGTTFKILLTLNEERLAWYKLTAGKNVIFTNHLDWSDERIIRTYRSMHKIENQFKILHGALLVPIKPVYHWTDQKIKAHIFLCMVALLFAKTLEFLCRNKTKGDFRQILGFASTIRLALVQREGKPKLVFEELDANQQALMEAFTLSRFAK